MSSFQTPELCLRSLANEGKPFVTDETKALEDDIAFIRALSVDIGRTLSRDG